MKRARSNVQGENVLSASSSVSLPSSQRGALVCLPTQERSLSLASSQGYQASINMRERVNGSPESDSSRETWDDADFHAQKAPRNAHGNPNNREDNGNHGDMHRIRGSNYPTLQDIACEPIEAIAESMSGKPRELSEDRKAELREILNGNGGTEKREEFAMLQNKVLSRKDLTPQSLTRANRSQLEILVAIKTGIQAFLHPDIPITQGSLMEVFFYKRCRNVACQNELPGDGCACEVCSTKNGFCNTCMCTICSKFDFDVNTCRWIGCDVCSHWTHTDCAIRVGQIAMGSSRKRNGCSPEMLYTCIACKHVSELFGWVKDVFHTCADEWEVEHLVKEFDTVRRIFHGSKDSKGKRLFSKAEELLKKLKDGIDQSVACKEMQCFFQGSKFHSEILEGDVSVCQISSMAGTETKREIMMTEAEAEDAREYEGDGDHMKMIEPREVCARIADVVHEAMAKMETVAVDKVRGVEKAHASFEAHDKELEDKKRYLQELQRERLKRKQEIEELGMMIRLKVAEADMFQTRADDARREADGLRRLVAEKSEKSEEEYSRYLKLRLSEVDADRRALFEKIQIREHSQLQPDVSQMLTLCKIQELLKWVSKRDSSMVVNEASELPL